MVSSEELIGTTEYLTLKSSCINRCHYTGVRLYAYYLRDFRLRSSGIFCGVGS
jgi:hypothetical protein